jgi:hypothetical protein
LLITGRKTDSEPTEIKMKPRVRKLMPRITGLAFMAKSRKAPTAMAMYPPGIGDRSAFELSSLRVEALGVASRPLGAQFKGSESCHVDADAVLLNQLIKMNPNRW